MSPARPGVRLGVDAGTVRVGLSRSDRDALLATPLETVARDEAGGTDLEAIAAHVADLAAVEVVVGLPRSLSGAEGPSARAARAYAVRIARRVSPVPVRLVDERLSTVTAQQRLREAGVKGRKHRPVVDQAAAVVILQSALDAERASGRPAGTLVPDPGPEGPRPGDEAQEERRR